MIATLRGTVLFSERGAIVLEVGGVGLRVEVTPSCASGSPVQSTASLFTQLVMREDSLTLYGFETQLECEVFSLLLGVSGVGPRSALGILSELSPTAIAHAVQSDDEKPFKQVSGIGPKTAKLIVVTLAGKLSQVALADESPLGESAHMSTAAADVVQALVGLGWAESAASDAVQAAQLSGSRDDEPELLKSALLLLQNAPGRRER